jgi:hypothetical protein
VKAKAALMNEDEFNQECTGKCTKKQTDGRAYAMLPSRKNCIVERENTFLFAPSPFAPHLRTLSMALQWGSNAEVVTQKPGYHIYADQASDVLTCHNEQ